jgi:hypothetical protein
MNEIGTSTLDKVRQTKTDVLGIVDDITTSHCRQLVHLDRYTIYYSSRKMALT